MLAKHLDATAPCRIAFDAFRSPQVASLDRSTGPQDKTRVASLVSLAEHKRKKKSFFFDATAGASRWRCDALATRALMRPDKRVAKHLHRDAFVASMQEHREKKNFFFLPRFSHEGFEISIAQKHRIERKKKKFFFLLSSCQASFARDKGCNSHRQTRDALLVASMAGTPLAGASYHKGCRIGC